MKNKIEFINIFPDLKVNIDQEKRLHKVGDKVYLLDAAGRIFNKSSEQKRAVNSGLNYTSGLN